MCGSGPSRIWRHNSIRDLVAKAIENVGYSIGFEHNGGLNDDRRPGDIIVYNWVGDKHLLIDIGVTNPLAAHNRSSLLREGPGGGAANTERRKRLHYKDIDKTKYIYYPFILETCGAFGKPALKLCSKLRKIWMTKCCNGNDSPNFSQNLESPTTSGSTDPLLISLSTLLQSHNGQMILERSPLSPKLLYSAIDRSLAQTRSHKKWANEKLHELQQPATLQRFSLCETKVSALTHPKVKQTTNLSYTGWPRYPTKNPTQEVGTLCDSISTPHETANTQKPELGNCIEDQTISTGIPIVDNEGILYAKRTGSNMIVQYFPPAAHRKDPNNHRSQEPKHDIQRKAPTDLHTDGLVGCPIFADDRSPRMDSEESPSKADVTSKLTTYTAPKRAICYGGPTMVVDDHGTGNDSNFTPPTNSSEQLLTSPASDGQHTKPTLSNAQHTQIVLPTSAPNGDWDDIQPPPPPVHARRVLELGKDIATPPSHSAMTQSWMELDEYETVRSKPESNPQKYGLDMDIENA